MQLIGARHMDRAVWRKAPCQQLICESQILQPSCRLSKGPNGCHSKLVLLNARRAGARVALHQPATTLPSIACMGKA